MTGDLKKVNQLIRTGELVSAQRELIGILQADPADEAAWFLLVKALPDTPDKIAALRACVKSNPESQRARRALENLQIQWAAEIRPPRLPEHPDPDILPPPPIPEPEPPAPEPVRRSSRRWWVAGAILLAALIILAVIIFFYR